MTAAAWLVLLACFTALGIVAAAIWETGYRLGVRHGRMLQSTEDRREVEGAVIAKAKAEYLAGTWERRARALLHAHFGPGRKP